MIGNCSKSQWCWQCPRPVDAFGSASQNSEAKLAKGYSEQERYVTLNLTFYQLCKSYSTDDASPFIDPHIGYVFSMV